MNLKKFKTLLQKWKTVSPPAIDVSGHCLLKNDTQRFLACIPSFSAFSQIETSFLKDLVRSSIGWLAKMQTLAFMGWNLRLWKVVQNPILASRVLLICCLNSTVAFWRKIVQTIFSSVKSVFLETNLRYTSLLLVRSKTL